MGDMTEGLDAEAYDRTYSNRQLLQRILKYLRPKSPILVLVAVTIVLSSVMDTALPVLVSRGVDVLAESITLEKIGMIIGGMFVSSLLSWLFNFLRQRYTARAVGDVVLSLRQDAFTALLDQDMSFYDEHPSGKIVSRVTADTQGFSTVVTLILDLLSQSMLVILITGVLFYFNVRLALWALVITPVIVLIALGFRRAARLATQRAQRALANINASVQETIAGITIAKRFRQEQTIYNEFSKVNRQVYHIQFRQNILFSGIFPVLVAATGVSFAAMVYYGGLNVLGGTISAGSWFLFLQAIGRFWVPLTSIAAFWSQFQQGLSASERVFALIDVEPRVVQVDQRPVSRLAGRIEFRDLSFRYTDRETVFQDFDWTIQAGETVALVGHTGAGKSSLGKLIARFYEFQDGQLLIDGHDICTFDLRAYRRQLAIVPQVPFLFSGTMLNNIRYARPQAANKEVATAAQQLGGGDWLEALPEDLETPVGELGKGLSMGQRQLVALARVLLQDPSIIILDEATASVDPLTEAQIREALAVVLKGRTAIIIAHRLSTVKNADRIVALRQGQIIEEGSHDELMEQGGYYAELYNTYFRHQELDYEPGKGFALVHQAVSQVPS